MSFIFEQLTNSMLLLTSTTSLVVTLCFFPKFSTPLACNFSFEKLLRILGIFSNIIDRRNSEGVSLVKVSSMIDTSLLFFF